MGNNGAYYTFNLVTLPVLKMTDLPWMTKDLIGCGRENIKTGGQSFSCVGGKNIHPLPAIHCDKCLIKLPYKITYQIY